MAFYQIHPENAGFQQLHDSNNPAAQAYARAALARNGIHVPPGADAAAMWRQFSSQRAGLRNQAQAQGPDPYDAGVNPNTPLGGPQTATQPTPYDPGAGAAGMPGLPIGPRLEGGGFPGQERFPTGGEHYPLAPGGAGIHMAEEGMLANNNWKAMIQQMAASLNPANTLQRAQNIAGEFQHNQEGPAAAALKLSHVADVQRRVGALANAMSHKRPSRAIPRRSIRSTPRAY